MWPNGATGGRRSSRFARGSLTHYKRYVKKVALGLGLRHDWGPQYCANQFLGELRWLGIRSTPSYVGEPECNGILERFGYRTPNDVRKSFAEVGA